jgi:hypothetical protein
MTAERGYIHDTFTILRDMAVKAHDAVTESGKLDGIDAGYELPLVNVLALLQHQADAFGIERATLGMDAFDPFVDVLGLKPMP